MLLCSLKEIGCFALNKNILKQQFYPLQKNNTGRTLSEQQCFLLLEELYDFTLPLYTVSTVVSNTVVTQCYYNAFTV